MSVAWSLGRVSPRYPCTAMAALMAATMINTAEQVGAIVHTEGSMVSSHGIARLNMRPFHHTVK